MATMSEPQARFDAACELDIVPRIAELESLGDELADRDDHDTLLLAQVRTSLGEALEAEGRGEDAVMQYHEAVRALWHESALVLQIRLAIALCLMGHALRKFGDLDLAVEAFECLASRFADATDPELVFARALGLCGKGEVLEWFQRDEEAVEAFAVFLAHDDPGGGWSVQVLRVRAWSRTAEALERLGRDIEARAAYEAVIAAGATCDDDDDDEEIRELIAEASDALRK